MPGEYIPSFGRPEPDGPEGDQLEDDGGDGFGRLRVALVPVLDEAATTAVMEGIRAQVAQAVRDGYRDGFEQAMAEMAGDEPDAGEDVGGR